MPFNLHLCAYPLNLSLNQISRREIPESKQKATKTISKLSHTLNLKILHRFTLPTAVDESTHSLTLSTIVIGKNINSLLYWFSVPY
jgi:hypothetical protein